MDDKIRELHRAGWSERRIATALGITRHRVRTALGGFLPAMPVHADSWFDEVELLLGRAKLRKSDEEQMELGVLALDVAEWLDDHSERRFDARQLAVSLSHLVEGVVHDSNPLVRIHARLARRLMDDSKGTKS